MGQNINNKGIPTLKVALTGIDGHIDHAEGVLFFGLMMSDYGKPSLGTLFQAGVEDGFVGVADLLTNFVLSLPEDIRDMIITKILEKLR